MIQFVRYSIVIFFFWSINLSIQGQTFYGVGLLPGLKLQKEMNDKVDLAFEMYSRLSYITGDFSGHRDRNLTYGLTDLSAFSYFKKPNHIQYEGGYLFRIQSGQTRHRLIQGVYWTKHKPKWTIEQRFRLDQTFGTETKPIFRARYRAMGTWPLKILSKKGKSSFKFSSELLGITFSKDFTMEMRLVADVKKNFTDKNYFEMGIDYRMDNVFTSSTSAHNFWLTMKYSHHF